MPEENSVANETALTTFSILSGIASGLGSIILSERLKKGEATDTNSLIIASIVSFGATLGAVFLVKSISKKL